MKQNNSSKCIFRAFLCVAFVLLVFSVPFGPTGTPRAEIEGECVMFCDDGGYSDSPTYDTGYGGGGGGCATYDQSSYYSGPSYIGEYHPDHSNVVWDGQYWTPGNGYEWVTNEQNDWRVQRIIGSYHPDYPNVVWNGEKWRPADGYGWYSDAPDDYRVISAGESHPSHANVFWNGEKWAPADGYIWANDIQGDFTVIGPGEEHPEHRHVIWNGEKWLPAEGYGWANDIQGDFNVVGPGEEHPEHRHVIWDGEQWTPDEGYAWAGDEGNFTVIGPGEAYPGHPNVIWNGEKLTPAEGYVWLNDTVDDFRVVTVEEAEQKAAATLALTELPSDRGLRINEVPSPSGFRTAAERQAQLDNMSNEQIDTELGRIRRTLVRMQSDFESKTADLNEWLKEAEQAEVDALKDSFGLLVGGAMKRFEGVWENYPRLKAIADNGLDYAGKLDLAIKTSQDPQNVQHQLEIAREMMMDAHKALVQEGMAGLSESGPHAAAFAKFLVDYSYHMTRWGIARNQINAISDNLGKPNGALEAQKAIKVLQEELISERDRRRAQALPSS